MEFDPKVEFLFTFYFSFLPKSFVPRIMYVKFPKKNIGGYKRERICKLLISTTKDVKLPPKYKM